MCKIIAFVSGKGSVGKTTSTINLNAYLKLQRKKVCMIDLDSTLHMSRKNCRSRTRNYVNGYILLLGGSVLVSLKHKFAKTLNFVSTFS